MIPSMTAPGGKLLDITIFSTAGSHSFTPLAETKSFKVTCIGGGGGPSGRSGGNNYIAAGGGGDGGRVEKFYNRKDLAYPVSLTVGSGGSVNNNGNATTFASLNAGGGLTAGPATNSTTAPTFQDGANGGNASGGDINIPGAKGLPVLMTTSNAISWDIRPYPGGGGRAAQGSNNVNIGFTGKTGICIIEQYG